MSIGAFSVVATTAPLTTQTIANETVLVADTEQSYTFPTGTQIFYMYVRCTSGAAQVKYTFTMGDSGTTYLTLEPGANRVPHQIIDASTAYTIYFQSPNAGTIIEIESWS